MPPIAPIYFSMLAKVPSFLPLHVPLRLPLTTFLFFFDYLPGQVPETVVVLQMIEAPRSCVPSFPNPGRCVLFVGPVPLAS